MEKRLLELERQMINQNRDLARVEGEFNDCRSEVYDKMQGFETVIHENLATATKTCKAVEGLVEVWDTGTSVVKFGTALRRFVQWIVIVGGFLWTVWYVVSNGELPPTPKH